MIGTVEYKLTGKRVLLTGATGFLGTHLARELTRLGAEVFALRRNPATGTRLKCEGVRWLTGDLTDAESLVAAVKQAAPEVIFHLAAYGTVFNQKDNQQAFAANVAGTWNLWQAIANTPCRLVYAGSCGEYGQAKGQVAEDHACRPTWFYPATKNAGTVMLSTLAKQTGREVVILRPFGPYGPADDPSRVIPQVILSLLHGEAVRVTAGEQLRDYAYVSDHVAAFILAGSQPLATHGAIYNIGSGNVIQLRQLIETIAAAVSSTAIQQVQFGAIPYRDSEVWEMCCDIGSARRDLGFEPKVSLADGIALTVEWYREHGKR